MLLLLPHYITVMSSKIEAIVPNYTVGRQVRSKVTQHKGQHFPDSICLFYLRTAFRTLCWLGLNNTASRLPQLYFIILNLSKNKSFMHCEDRFETYFKCK